MRIHHLNCVSLCPLGGSLMDGRSIGKARGHLVCHCLLIETSEGLVLVDTGFGLRDVADPTRLSEFFRMQLAPDLKEEDTAIRQIARLGLDPKDVRHIVLTHLDFDHAGGLDDFPQARIHLLAPEREAARARRTWLDQQRFRPRQWPEDAAWETYRVTDGERWFGFEAVRELRGLPPEILLVPLIGHTLGHCGVAVRSGDHWMLHAGDAYFFHREMARVAPRSTPGLRLYQTMMQVDGRLRHENQRRLRLLHREHPEIRLFCAHDPTEFARETHRRASPVHPPEELHVG